jgi:hypothetical protein
MDTDNKVREELVSFLKGGKAFMPFTEAVEDFPITEINTRPPNVDYTFWHLLEHIRFTQKDIIDFIIDPNYKEQHWPDDYWPKKDAKASKKDWESTITTIEKDTAKMIEIVKDKGTDIYAKLPNGSGQTIFREAILVSEHNAYHTGEFAILRQVCKLWNK